MKSAQELTIVQIDAAIFAYEPILRTLQTTFTMALSPEVLFWQDGDDIGTPTDQPDGVIQKLLQNSNANLRSILNLKKDVKLDVEDEHSKEDAKDVEVDIEDEKKPAKVCSHIPSACNPGVY